ncbi:MAG: hypothetical protein ACP5IL_03050 [Syntrophobacteraceae bacterium]
MENRERKASRLDYTTLQDLARSRNVTCIEARGLDLRKGVRFTRDGHDWIAVDSDLPVGEKIRALGFLLENEPAAVAEAVGFKSKIEGTSLIPVLTMCCS